MTMGERPERARLQDGGEEPAQRRDEVIRHMLNTAPKTEAEMRVGLA